MTRPWDAPRIDEVRARCEREKGHPNLAVAVFRNDLRDALDEIERLRAELDLERKHSARQHTEDVMMLDHERSRGDALVRGGEVIIAERDALRAAIVGAAKHLKHGPRHAGGRGACEDPCIKCMAGKL